jgi:hypothetical protein
MISRMIARCTRVVKRSDVKETGKPGSGSFSDQAAEDGSKYYMSVYFEDAMADAGKTAADLEAHWNRDGDNYRVYQFSAKALRDAGEKLWRDPNDDFPGHGACKRHDDSERTRGQKRELARRSVLPSE